MYAVNNLLIINIMISYTNRNNNYNYQTFFCIKYDTYVQVLIVLSTETGKDERVEVEQVFQRN